MNEYVVHDVDIWNEKCKVWKMMNMDDSHFKRDSVFEIL
jgi:hypothetical protein